MTENEKKHEYDPKWNGDVLERSESAKFLTKYLNSLYAEEVDEATNSDSFVLCLNAEWGYGKTFLIKNWANDLKTDLNHPVVYFDAWQNDFSDDPLLAFISELEQAFVEFKKAVPGNSQLIDKIIETGKGAIAPVLKTAANIALKNLIGADIDGIAQLAITATESSIETYVSNTLQAHNNRKTKIIEFSNNLIDLLDKMKVEKYRLPMYVFIDELDRCKPSYAIQLLEGIKHIFGTKGVFFIIATNKTQLSKSIKAVYGAEFDSLTYLQRFFDQEYQIPKPDFNSFSKLLVENKYRLNQSKVDLLKLKCSLTQTFSLLAQGFDLSLRAQDQVAKQYKAIELSWSLSPTIHHWFLLFLLMLKIKSELAYEEFNSTPDSTSRWNSLKQYFDLTAKIQGFLPSESPYNQTPGEIEILKIIDEYLKFETNNLLEIYQEIGFPAHTENYGTLPEIRNSFMREIPNATYGNYIMASIGQYKKLIMHAGQLS